MAKKLTMKMGKIHVKADGRQVDVKNGEVRIRSASKHAPDPSKTRFREPLAVEASLAKSGWFAEPGSNGPTPVSLR